jgi:hypothetical protein
MEESKDSRRAIRVFGVGLIVVLAGGALVAPGPAGGRGGYGPGGGYGERTPTPEPVRTAQPTPVATTSAPPPDTTAPSVNSRPVRGQTARSILKRGLLISVTCSEDCRHVTQAFVARNQARKLRIKPKARRRVLVAKKTTLLKGGVAQTIRVKLNKKAKRGIRRMKARKVRKLKLTIAASARDASNNVRRSSTTLSFKR